MDAQKTYPWRSIVVEALRDDIGPLAPVLVDDVIAHTDFKPGAREMDDITQFLKKLRGELPSCIDASRFVLEINREVLTKAGNNG